MPTRMHWMYRSRGLAKQLQRALVSDSEVRVLEAYARLGRPENPFLPERVADERAALGRAATRRA